MNSVRRKLRIAAGWSISHLIVLPIAALVCISRAAEALAHAIAWLVDDRAWVIGTFDAADRIEQWAKRRI